MARDPYRFFYTGAIKGTDTEIELPSGESHHLTRVLRLAEGDRVTVFDRKGQAWLGEYLGRNGDLARVAPLKLVESAPQNQARVIVACSTLKRRAMDWMIEKLSELDVAAMQPLVCRRTVAAPSSEGSGQLTPARWERIATAAAKQSGRNIPLHFYPTTPLPVWLKRERPNMLACFAHNGPGAVPFGQWLGDRAGMGMPTLAAVGPEGGWTQGEVEAFQAAGFQPVSLGPLVLRAETAAVTVAAACRVML